MAIAEGDTLVLCIRLASEILLGRYSLPSPKDPSLLLAKHEAGLLKEALALINDIEHKDHRSDSFNHLILPLCLPLIRSIGHRMAYEAAVKHKVDPLYISLYESFCVKHDSSWYTENLPAMDRRTQHITEERLLTEAAPQIESLLEATGFEHFTLAPIVSDIVWEKFVDKLETRGLPHPDHFKETTPTVASEPDGWASSLGLEGLIPSHSGKSEIFRGAKL